MAIYKESVMDIELNSGTINRTFCNKMIGEWDENGDVFGVRLLRDGQEVPLQFVTCTGLFEKPNGTTVPIPGQREGNIAYVQLPKTCYSDIGQFKLAIKLSFDNETATIRIVDGTVVQTADGPMIDPGSAIPDMEGLDAILEELQALVLELEQFLITEEQITGTRYRIIVTTLSGIG